MKKYYDTCLVEKAVDNKFRADLLLTSSKNEHRIPILIEIEYSHACESEKINSDNKIIELKIKTDIDFQNLINGDIEESENVKFYGFNKISQEVKQLEKRAVFRFYLFKNGNAFVSNYEDMPTCQEGKSKSYSILELNVDPEQDYLFQDPSVYDYGYAYALREGLDIKNCRICKYYKSGFSPWSNKPIFCKISSKVGTPRYPHPTEANSCEHYILDTERMELLKATLANIPIMKVEK